VRRYNLRLDGHLRRLHAQGLSGRQIARRLKRSASFINRRLRRLRLPSNARPVARGAWTDLFRRRFAALQKGRIRRFGAEEVCNFLRRLNQERATAIRLGWPQVGTLLEARILALLHAEGPLTLTQICERLSVRKNWTGLTVRALRRRGLLARRGRTSRWLLYGLADGVAPAPVRPSPRRLKGGAS
jgi:predicted DNA-binding transcriptional regulator